MAARGRGAHRRRRRRRGARAPRTRRSRCAEREPALDARVRDAARAARARSRAGAWRPRHVLMHGDLWGGNVLGAPGAPPFSRRFVLIDWDTSRAEGYPFFDLVRAARSFGVARGASGTRARGAQPRCSASTLAQSRAALVAALGHIGLVRESFPLERYAAMCRDSAGHVRRRGRVLSAAPRRAPLA